MFGSICLVLSLVVVPSLGYPSFQEQIPNALNIPHPCKANYRWPGVGHKNPLGGGERNVFGHDFHDMGYYWSPQLCAADSDGDGKTNGEELGDPYCTWSPGQTPERTTDITHPGVCDPYDSELCKARNEFLDCELDKFESCDAINNPDVKTVDITFTRTQVPPTETNYYCMTFDLPSDQEYHLIANEALIDNANVLHHMVVYACDSPDDLYIPTPSPCGMSAEGKCGQVISLWTVGLSGNCFGDDVGYRIGLNGYRRIKLEIHYNNPQMVPDYTDASGLRLYYQPVKPGVQDLATWMIGQGTLEIPPGESRVETKGVCTGSCTQYLLSKPAYVINTINHMHYLGRSMKVEVFRNGVKIHELSNDEVYNYDSPVTHVNDPPKELLPGDDVVTTCVFNSLNTDHWTFYGEGTQDEMCYAFLTVYPADALVSPTCVAYGPLDPCELYNGQPVGGCDWKMMTNISTPMMSDLYAAVKKNCNVNGFCRPECEGVLERIKDHPCFVGEAKSIVTGGLATYYEGMDFLARIHSCPWDGHTSGPQDCKDECQKYCWDDDRGQSSSHKTAAVSAILVVVASASVMFL